MLQLALLTSPLDHELIRSEAGGTCADYFDEATAFARDVVRPEFVGRTNPQRVESIDLDAVDTRVAELRRMGGFLAPAVLELVASGQSGERAMGAYLIGRLGGRLDQKLARAIASDFAPLQINRQDAVRRGTVAGVAREAGAMSTSGTPSMQGVARLFMLQLGLSVGFDHFWNRVRQTSNIENASSPEEWWSIAEGEWKALWDRVPPSITVCRTLVHE